MMTRSRQSARELRIPDMRTALIALSLLAIIAVPAMASGGVIVVSPSKPTSDSTIVVSATFPGICQSTTDLTIRGNVIRSVIVPSPDCVVMMQAPTTHAVSVGSLEPGTYTYQLYRPDGATLLASTSFTVLTASPPVPSLGNYGLALLAIIFVGAGTLVVGRLA